MRGVKDVLGVILGGGKGTRLFPLTLIRSKPAVPLGGKYRLIDIPISNCINAGINKIFVLTQFNSESLNRHINQTYRFGLFSQGFVDILAAEQTPESVRWYQGTADAVRQTLRHMLNYQARHVLILSGDHLYRMDYERLVRIHQETKAGVTVCVIPVGIGEASSFGILKMDQSGRINEFFEKPKDPKLLDLLKVDLQTWRKEGVTAKKPLMASMGIYLFNTEVLTEVLADETKMDFGRDIIPSALSDHDVRGYIFGDYWEDIGTIKAFYRANMDLTLEKPKFSFYEPGAPIYTHPRFLPATRISDCKVEQSIIAEGCEIRRSRVSRSVIGIRSIIRDDTEIVRTLMMGADYYDTTGGKKIPIGIGKNSVIRDAIIDKNARIGANVQIVNKKKLKEFDGGNFFVRDGIVIIPKNAEIESGTRI